MTVPAADSPPARPPAVVLLHHFGGSRRTWAEVIPKLAGLTVVAPDLRGFGGRRLRDGEPFTVEAAADDVVNRCDALQLGRIVVVGHSFGARMAMILAARQPHRVAGLVLVAPSPPSPEPMTDAGRDALRHAQDTRANAAALVNHITGEPKLPPPLATLAIDDVLAADPAAWAAWCDTASYEDLTALVSAVRCPVAVLSGDRDAAIPPAVVERETVGRLPQATLEHVADAGHLLPLERPDVVAAGVRRMVDQVGPGTAAAAAESIRDLIATDLVTEPTRRVLQERAAWRSSGPQFFTADEMVTLAALCDAMVPQDGVPDDPTAARYKVDIAGEIDRRIAHDGRGKGSGNGWRYADQPPDGEAYRRGLAAFDAVASPKRFHELSRDDRLAILRSIRAETNDPTPWRAWGISAKRVVEEWLAEAVEIYYSHPGGGMADLNYVGFADGRGWQLENPMTKWKLWITPGSQRRMNHEGTEDTEKA